jgi:actin-related protein
MSTNRIATPNQLVNELRRVVAYCETENPSRKRVARILVALAESTTVTQKSSQDDKLLVLHFNQKNEDWLKERRKRPASSRRKQGGEFLSTTPRIVAKYLDAMSQVASDRLSFRFYTPEAMREYIEEHPRADRSNHFVKPLTEEELKEKEEEKEKEKKEKEREKHEETSPKKPEEKSEGSSKTQESLKDLGVTNEDIEAVAKEQAKTFDTLIEEGRKAAKTFDYDDDNPRAIKEWGQLSEAEKLLTIIGPKIGEKFEANLRGALLEKHTHFKNEWAETSTSKGAQEMMGLLSSLGVKGSPAPDDAKSAQEAKIDLKKVRDDGSKDAALKEYAKRAYIYQQAFFKHLGVKEVTLYREVYGQGLTDDDGKALIPPKDGSTVGTETREISSFTADPSVAMEFGRCIKYKVPVGQVFSSMLVNPEFGRDSKLGEDELVIMGASSLKGTLVAGPTKDPESQQKLLKEALGDRDEDG